MKLLTTTALLRRDVIFQLQRVERALSRFAMYEVDSGPYVQSAKKLSATTLSTYSEALEHEAARAAQGLPPSQSCT